MWMILLLGVALRIAHHPVQQRTPDEMSYTMYAHYVATYGPGYIPRFVRSINQNPEPGHFSWPQRVGYIMILAGAITAAGQSRVEVVAAVSLTASLLTLALVWWWGRVAFDRRATAIALLFVATSPIDLAIARRAWQDDVLGWLVLLMAFGCARSWMEPARARWPALFLSAGFVAILVKESAWPVYGAGVVLLAWLAWRARPTAVPGAGVRLALGALGMAAAVTAIVAACGGVAETLATWKTAQIVNVPNEYMRRYQTGSVLYYLTGLGALQPLLLVVGLTGAITVAVRPWISRRTEDHRIDASLSVLAWLVLGLGAVAALYPQKNLRFVSPLLAPSALLGAWVLQSWALSLASRLPQARRHWVVIGLAALLITSSFLDVVRFREYFIRRGIPDLATPWLFEAPGTAHPEAGAR